jgi:hypothetical protein
MELLDYWVLDMGPENRKPEDCLDCYFKNMDSRMMENALPQAPFLFCAIRPGTITSPGNNDPNSLFRTKYVIHFVSLKKTRNNCYVHLKICIEE